MRCSSSARSTSASAATGTTRPRPIAICSSARLATRRRCAASSAPTLRSATRPGAPRRWPTRSRRWPSPRAAKRWSGSASSTRTCSPSPIAPMTPTAARSSSAANPHAALGRLRTAVRAREPVALAEAMARLEPLVTADGDGAAARAVLVDERAAWRTRPATSRARSRAAMRRSRSTRRRGCPGWRGRGWRRRAARSPRSATRSRRWRERSADPALQSALQRRAGLLALSSSSRATRTAEAAERRLRQAHALTPSDPSSLVALCALATDPDALGARAKLAEGAAQTEWHVDHGEALEAAGRLGDAAQATLRALEIDPHHLGALELLRRLARAGERRQGLRGGDGAPGAEVLEGERAAGFYREAAETFERVGAPPRGRRRLARRPRSHAARRRRRQPRARRFSTRSTATTKIPSALVELFTHRLDHVRGADDRVRLHLDRATLFADGGDRRLAPRSDLRAALDLDPDEPEALRRLAELLAQRPAGRDEAIALFEPLPRRRRRSPTGAARPCSTWPSCTTVGRHRRGAWRGSRRRPSWRRSRSRRAPSRRSWRSCSCASGSGSTRSRPCGGLSDLVDAGKERAAVEIRIATIYREGFSDPRAAVEALLRALQHRSAVDGGARPSSCRCTTPATCWRSSSRRSSSAPSTPRARRRRRRRWPSCRTSS